jgi:hypothetical protein
MVTSDTMSAERIPLADTSMARVVVRLLGLSRMSAHTWGPQETGDWPAP